jgi:hypothetical protein
MLILISFDTKEFQEFSKRVSDIQNQYRQLMIQLIPGNEAESRSLLSVRQELNEIPEENVVYHSHGKM